MHLVRVTHADTPRVGVQLDDAETRLAALGTTMGQLLADPELRAVVAAEGEPGAPGDRLLPPLDPTAVVVNIGTNYHDHALPAQDAPRPALTWFIKSPRTWIAAGEGIRIPPQWPDRVDYEGELGVVFGSECHLVSEAEAWSHIGGLTLLNDVSARDAWPELTAATTPAEERAAWNRMMLGKQLPTFGPIGPTIVTMDEIADPQALELRTRLNGEIVQQAPVSRMKIGVAQLISQLSEFFHFHPGDVISTGTPGGVGQARGRYLRPGDEVSVEVDGVGVLTSPVV